MNQLIGDFTTDSPTNTFAPSNNKWLRFVFIFVPFIQLFVIGVIFPQSFLGSVSLILALLWLWIAPMLLNKKSYRNVTLSFDKEAFTVSKGKENIAMPYPTLADINFQYYAQKQPYVKLKWRVQQAKYCLQIDTPLNGENRLAVIRLMQILKNQEITFEEYDQRYEATHFLMPHNPSTTQYDKLIDEIGKKTDLME